MEGNGATVARAGRAAHEPASHELVDEGPGDILVFLPGEREIRDTADVLTGERWGRGPGSEVDVVPHSQTVTSTLSYQ